MPAVWAFLRASARFIGIAVFCLVAAGAGTTNRSIGIRPAPASESPAEPKAVDAVLIDRNLPESSVLRDAVSPGAELFFYDSADEEATNVFVAGHVVGP